MGVLYGLYSCDITRFYVIDFKNLEKDRFKSVFPPGCLVTCMSNVCIEQNVDSGYVRQLGYVGEKKLNKLPKDLVILNVNLWTRYLSEMRNDIVSMPRYSYR